MSSEVVKTMTSKHEQGITAAATALRGAFLVFGGGDNTTWEDYEAEAHAAVSAYLSTVLDETELAEVIEANLMWRKTMSDGYSSTGFNDPIDIARAVISHLRGGNDE